jgi:cytochrome-b5 reductase
VPAKAGERPADTPAPKALTGGDQGFLDLKLSNVETVNHNTKRFRFELPEKDQVSGLDVACESLIGLLSLPWSCADEATAAIITKFKAPEAEKPVIRPYTPVSDEG